MNAKLGLFWGVVQITLFSQIAKSQVIPDTTLPQNSQVINQGGSLIINGGTEAGKNLFHSFKEFSIPTGTSAFFNNALSIENIFSRVTSGSVSSIDGMISANGSAHLFLLNPNGIIFGPNAILNIGGSFVGTTANSIVFADGNQFSADPKAPPILTISSPVGLDFKETSGGITVQGTGSSLPPAGTISNPLEVLIRPFLETGENNSGLRTRPFNSLALIGGEIKLDGGIIRAFSGNIHLGSIAQGQVEIKQFGNDFFYDYTQVRDFKNIVLSQKSLLDASGFENGGIELFGENIVFHQGSAIIVNNFGNRSLQDINLSAQESVNLNSSLIHTQNFLQGDGADIQIKAKTLGLFNTSGLLTSNLSSGKGGDLIINLLDKAQIIGLEGGFVSTFILSRNLGMGQGGNLEIISPKLSLMNQGSMAIFNLGQGRSGDLKIESQTLEILGGAFEKQTGIFIPSSLGTTTLGLGQGGDVIIDTNTLVLRDGGLINVTTVGAGKTGNAVINAREFVEISNSQNFQDLDLNSISQIFVSADIPSPLFTQGLKVNVPEGDSGDLVLNTNRLRLLNGGQVSVRNEGRGRAGNLHLKADSIFLDNSGIISATTASGEGGNISIQSRSLQLGHGSEISSAAGGTGNGGSIEIFSPQVFLDEDSQISAAADTGEGGNVRLNSSDIRLFNSRISAAAGGAGNGGNILIDTDTLISFENSKIAANAIEGRGGNVGIAAQGIFLSPDSSITASSEFGVDGEVRINVNSFQVDWAETGLPTNFPSAEESFAQICLSTSKKQSRFTVQGTGGLPVSPGDSVDAYTLQDIIPLGQAIGVGRTPEGRIYAIGCPTSETSEIPSQQE